MDLSEVVTCPKCKSHNLLVKRKVTYVYTYKLNAENADEILNKTEELPFLFDNREKSESIEYIKCENCGEKYQIDLDDINKKINLTIVRKAFVSDYVENPGFYG